MVAPALALVALAVAGCGSSGSPSTASAGGSTSFSNTGNTGSGQAPEPAKVAADASSPHELGVVQQRAVISRGSIALTSGDVAQSRARLDTVLAREHGHVADENTTTDDDGNVLRSHLVVRVPSASFDDAMSSLSAIASLRSASRTAEDVTTQVIDLHARILAERAGVRRLRHLVTHTASLPALLQVERALTERQGELESLRQQRAYLHDETTLATITVDIIRRVAPAPAPEHAAGGFVGGLEHGWHALVAVVTGLLLAFGAVLPFALACVVLGVPAWIVARRVRRSREVSAPAES